MGAPLLSALLLVGGVLLTLAIIWACREAWAVTLAYENTLRCPTIFCPETYDAHMGLVFPSSGADACVMPIRPDNYPFHRSVLNLLMNANVNAGAQVQAPPGTQAVLRIDRPERPCMAFGVTEGRKMAIVFRGLTDLRDDLDFRQVERAPGVAVHEGYCLDFDDLAPELLRAIRAAAPDILVLAGHSLGGALAILAAPVLKRDFPQMAGVVVTYGTPRVGNAAFAASLHGVAHLRIENEADVVPALPPSVCPNSAQPQAPFLYAHSGQAQRFQSNWASIINNHSLGCYKAWLDGLPADTWAPGDGP
jgi:triacylglycerol lipase